MNINANKETLLHDAEAVLPHQTLAELFAEPDRTYLF